MSSLNLRDAQLKGTLALPSAASTTVNGGGVDTADGTHGALVARSEFLLTYPAVTTTMAPDGDTITYSVIESVNSDMSSPTVKYPSVAVQTGAGGAGAAGGTFRFRTEVDCSRYIGVRIVSGSGITNSSAVSATLEMLF
ncbi:MAG TPA: hypothetical protein VFE46_10780 [Pirellulales bacterium]|nr:hypothetical protein [Pirellulales bacterium]